jgi:hypothetical protein
MAGLKIETKLVVSKVFPAGTSDFTLHRYLIHVIPSTTDGQGEAVLEFANQFSDQEGGGSHPEEEANIVCNLLALILEAKVSRRGLRINAIEVPAQFVTTDELVRGTVDWSTADADVRCVLGFGDDVARQLVRGSKAYASAIESIPSDPTFAFFLLVVAVECLSSQSAVIPPSELPIDSKKCERFCLFIQRYLPDAHRGEDERNAGLFQELLKEVYYAHRSAFVHGGKEVTNAALMADLASSSYFKHATSGKEVKTPGLRWFARVVRGALLGFSGGRTRRRPIGAACLREGKPEDSGCARSSGRSGCNIGRHPLQVRANIGLEPTRQTVCAIMALRRAAQADHWTACD